MSRLTWWALCGVFSLVVAGAFGGLRLNLSGSIPVGLYMIERGDPERGSIVLACLPASVSRLAMERGYVRHGGSCPGGAMPIGKPVLGIPGDTIDVTNAGLFLNGIAVPQSEALSKDRQGRPLPQVEIGTYVVRKGELWLVSKHSRFSFDSRYFGPINTIEVRARVRPLWIERAAPVVPGLANYSGHPIGQPWRE